MTDQLGKTEAYTYDGNDNLTSVTDRKGQTTTYAYDKMNRISKAQYADDSSTSYTYDAVGRLTYINDSQSGVIQYGYSNTGCSSGCKTGFTDRVMQEIMTLGSISYEYDAVGRRTKMTVAGQPDVDYSYDVNGRLLSVSGAGLNPTQIVYDALGRRASMTLPNGVTTNYTYDNASRLLNLEHLDPIKAILEQIGYEYDANGNRTKMDRMNITPKLPTPASNITYNSANQMLSFNDSSTGSARTMTYDNNGNMMTITNLCGTTSYTWDARNRLSSIAGFNTDCSQLTAAFKYDALGRRIEKSINGKTTDYLYDGIDIVQEIENGSVAANYLRTLRIDEPLARIKTDGTTRYYQADALGSIISLTDETGMIKTQYNYDPFGNTEMTGETSDNPLQYTARENDGTGLYYYRARYYNPELQRFISEDPIGLKGGINLYAYTSNNPVNFIDPWGLILTNAEIANIIFNETRSFSGASVATARLNIAHAIINGDNALGNNRPVTAPTTATVPSTEQATYQQIQFAVELARFQQTEGGIDPTNGAMNFNFRNNDSIAPFYGLPVQTHVGPLDNSYTGGGLNSTGVWANTYGRCNR